MLPSFSLCFPFENSFPFATTTVRLLPCVADSVIDLFHWIHCQSYLYPLSWQLQIFTKQISSVVNWRRTIGQRIPYLGTSEFFSITAEHLFSSRLSKLHLEEDRLSPSSFIFSFHSTRPARLFQHSTVDLRGFQPRCCQRRSLRRSHPSEGRYPPQIRLKHRTRARAASSIDAREK